MLLIHHSQRIKYAIVGRLVFRITHSQQLGWSNCQIDLYFIQHNYLHANECLGGLPKRFGLFRSHVFCSINFQAFNTKATRYVKIVSVEGSFANAPNVFGSVFRGFF